MRVWQTHETVRAYWNQFDKCQRCRAWPGMSCRENGSRIMKRAHPGRWKKEEK